MPNNCGGVGMSSRNWGGGVWGHNDYPSGRDHSGGEHGASSSSESSSERDRVLLTHSLQKQQVTNVASSLIKLHGSKPGLILGYNPEIPYTIKDDCGFSLQIKGLINDLNYQLKVSGFKDAKGIVLPHSDLRDVDMAILAPHLQPFQWNLTVIDFSNNAGLGDKAIENLFYTMGTHQVPAKYVQSFNLSNCNIGDVGAEYIAESLKSGRYPNTRNIDLSGNKITGVGEGYLTGALKSSAVELIAITLEIHKGQKAVTDFLKKGSSYYFKEFVKNFKNNIDTQYIKTDEDSAFMHCKDGVPKAVVGVTLGVAKCTNPIAKIINSLPQPGEKTPFVTKAVNKLGLFACVMSEEGDNIVTPDLIGCGVEIGEYFNGD